MARALETLRNELIVNRIIMIGTNVVTRISGSC